jgi:hypothetical protein
MRDLLCAQMLLNRKRIVRAALHGRVVGDDDARAALDRRDARYDPRGRRVVVVGAVRGKRGKLEERREPICQSIDALARGQFATLAMPGDCGEPAARTHAREALP